MLRGKLTYTGLAITLLASVGVKISPAEADAIRIAVLHGAEAAGVVVAAYGRWRATR